MLNLKATALKTLVFFLMYTYEFVSLKIMDLLLFNQTSIGLHCSFLQSFRYET